MQLTVLNGLDENFKWKSIDPVVIDKKDAPCKEVICTGDDVDIFRFPWIKTIPLTGASLSAPAVR